MEKPKRSTKKIDYAAIENGESDCEDFLPVKSKNKRSKECHESNKGSGKEAVITPRLSPAEKRFKRDTESAMLLSSSPDENKENLKSVSKIEDPMPGTSWGLTAERQRKQLKSYDEGEQSQTSSEEFEGWDASSDDSDFSPVSPILNKKKIIKAINTVNLPVVRVPPASNKAKIVGNNISSVQKKAEQAYENLDMEMIVNETSSDGKSSSDDEHPTPEVPVEITAVPIVQNDCTVQLVKSPLIIQTSSLLPPCKSPVARTKSQKGEIPKKQSSKETIPNTKLVVSSNSAEKYLIPSRSSPVAKSSFKSPVIGGSPQLNAGTNSSAKIGLRLGLSRKGNFKPLHPKASVS